MQPMSLHKRASRLRIAVVERDLRVRKGRFENHVRAQCQPVPFLNSFCWCKTGSHCFRGLFLWNFLQSQVPTLL